MNGVQTRLKCKPNVKRCKRFVFAAHSPLLHPNTLKTKAIIHFQTDHILTRFVFPPLLESLPAIKSVYGNLNIARTPIRHLPENIIIGNDLEAYCSDIETLPENSRIGGNICLSGCKNLKSLPDGLVVNGDLDLNESSLTELPDKLIVGGNLDIRSTSIQKLPDDLVVGGKIKMDANQANVSNVRTELPTDLPHLIWKNSGYMYVKDKLYKVIEQHDDYCIVITPILDVYREITGSDSIDSEYRFYVMKDGSHYGIGNSLKEAQLDLSSTMRKRKQ